MCPWYFGSVSPDSRSQPLHRTHRLRAMPVDPFDTCDAAPELLPPHRRLSPLLPYQWRALNEADKNRKARVSKNAQQVIEIRNDLNEDIGLALYLVQAALCGSAHSAACAREEALAAHFVAVQARAEAQKCAEARAEFASGKASL